MLCGNVAVVSGNRTQPRVESSISIVGNTFRKENFCSSSTHHIHSSTSISTSISHHQIIPPPSPSQILLSLQSTPQETLPDLQDADLRHNHSPHSPCRHHQRRSPHCQDKRLQVSYDHLHQRPDWRFSALRLLPRWLPGLPRPGSSRPPIQRVD